MIQSLLHLLGICPDAAGHPDLIDAAYLLAAPAYAAAWGLSLALRRLGRLLRRNRP